MLKCEVCKEEVTLVTKSILFNKLIFSCSNCYNVLMRNPLIKYDNRKKNELGIKNKILYRSKSGFIDL